MNYPEEWNQLSKHDRKRKIKQLMRKEGQKTDKLKKIRNWGIAALASVVVVSGFLQLTKKTPEQIAFEQEVKKISLDEKVREFPIEGRDHVSAETDVGYKTNPPTSGSHLGEAKNWGVYEKELDDKAAVHGLEHGGIWISYKDIDDETKTVLEEIGRSNSQSVIVSPRSANDVKITIASWGKMIQLETVDRAVIQKYINTYKNQGPEKLAR